MATITRYRGAWSVRWTDRNGQHRRRCPDKRTAETLQREIERAHALGRIWEPASARAPTRLGEAMTAYVKARAADLAPSTLLRATDTLTLAKRSMGADLPIAELSKHHLEGFWAFMRDPSTSRHGKGRTLDTCKKHLQSFHTFWVWMAEDGRYDGEVPPPRRYKVRGDPPKLPRAPTWAECDRMIACLHVEWMRRVAVLARFTGARASELLALQWSAVDLEQGVIRWDGALTKGGYGGRIVPIPPALHVELAGWGRREGPVCAAPAGAYGHLHDDFRRAWKRSGVPVDRFDRQPTHAFRKALETELRLRGVSPEVLNAYVGHADQSTAGRHYADPRWAIDRMRDAVSLIPPVAVHAVGHLEVV